MCRRRWPCTPSPRNAPPSPACPTCNDPDPASGLPGLWLAGDYVAGDYPATLEGAVRSGVAAARLMLGA
ncbi:MAG: FAD-dependent oxidoreductase [Sulfuritalea sp.]|nr:FAD-dependent oxidoreductase [Sulfuritalea sp.]